MLTDSSCSFYSCAPLLPWMRFLHSCPSAAVAWTLSFNVTLLVGCLAGEVDTRHDAAGHATLPQWSRALPPRRHGECWVCGRERMVYASRALARDKTGVGGRGKKSGPAEEALCECRLFPACIVWWRVSEWVQWGCGGSFLAGSFFFFFFFLFCPPPLARVGARDLLTPVLVGRLTPAHSSGAGEVIPVPPGDAHVASLGEAAVDSVLRL